MRFYPAISYGPANTGFCIAANRMTDPVVIRHGWGCTGRWAAENESEFYPFGGELQFSAADSSNYYKFTGKERDAESNLDYFGARYYSSTLGRWTAADWSAAPAPVPYADFTDPQSLNLYSYVRNIPTSHVDPDGHQCDLH